MFRRTLLPVIFILLGWGFYVSPDFKEIAAGVSIFLFGMLALEEGFRAFTGGLLDKLLKMATDKLWKSIGFGIVATTIMQSSSLVSVLTISFLGAGLIWLSSGIGIIFGANIGTTTGAWLVAGLGLKVKISAYAMPMLVFGIILIFQKSKGLKGAGYILAGLGFLFLGIHHMKEGFEAFKSTIDLAAYAMPGFLGLMVFCAIGIFATVVMQSSHATLVLIITALAAGQITYENALALAIGANIGTTITAILGAMSSNYQGKRLAGAHLVFNLVTGLIAIAFISPLVWAVDSISMTVGIAEDDYALKLAVFHTIFNLIGVIVMTPLVGPLVKGLRRVIPRPMIKTVEPRYINDISIQFPETLLESVRRETLHLYDNSFGIMARGLNIEPKALSSDAPLQELLDGHRSPIEFDLDEVYTSDVKALYGAILDFISRAQTELPHEYSTPLYELRDACHGVVQSVKDIKHLRPNMAIHLTSENPHMQAEYDKMRLMVTQLMRDLRDLRIDEETDHDILALDRYKVAVEEKNILTDGTLDRMIREGQITPYMATSLMNDLSYTRDLIWNLVKMAKAVFGSKELEVREAEELVRLTEEDIEDMSDPQAIIEQGQGEHR
ncbi:Na/Pi cotransporter family protein [Magnetospira sp. QH-2]|uniref:Na/Pi cotransporter family protein n=1 Tax=Magnetospira sp. (strain QH-2) TaxID=1288970 RepID=UPI0005F9F96F|nr:Na/Pi symporter [Magnetospira sp. QH-2]